MKTEETKSCETCRLHFDSNKRCNSLIRCIGGSQWESKETKEVIFKECDMSLLLGKTVSSVQGGDQFIKIITTTGEEFKINAGFDVKSDEAYLFVEIAQEQNETCEIKDLRKNDKFVFNQNKYTVKRMWLSDERPLIAIEEYGSEKRFYHEGLEIIKIK